VFLPLRNEFIVNTPTIPPLARRTHFCHLAAVNLDASSVLPKTCSLPLVGPTPPLPTTVPPHRPSRSVHFSTLPPPSPPGPSGSARPEKALENPAQAREKSLQPHPPSLLEPHCHHPFINQYNPCRGSSIGRACGSYNSKEINLKVVGSSPTFGYSYHQAHQSSCSFYPFVLGDRHIFFWRSEWSGCAFLWVLSGHRSSDGDSLKVVTAAFLLSVWCSMIILCCHAYCRRFVWSSIFECCPGTHATIIVYNLQYLGLSIALVGGLS
jgi:hypothetical protein